MMIARTPNSSPSKASEQMDEVKGCGWSYSPEDEVTYCTFSEGHGRVNQDGKNRTLFDHGSMKYGIWWDEDSSFAVGPSQTKDVTDTETVIAEEVPISQHSFATKVNFNIPTPVTVGYLALLNPDGEVISKQPFFRAIKAGDTVVVDNPVGALAPKPDPEDQPLDMVNHPPHYTAHPSGVECIQVTRHMSFNLGNVVKYIWRSGEKGARLEDLQKAAWYLNDEIERMKNG